MAPIALRNITNRENSYYVFELLFFSSKEKNNNPQSKIIKQWIPTFAGMTL